MHVHCLGRGHYSRALDLTRNSLVRFVGALDSILTFAIPLRHQLGYHVTAGDRYPVHVRCERDSLAYWKLMLWH